jgi:hypothetical protein
MKLKYVQQSLELPTLNVALNPAETFTASPKYELLMLEPNAHQLLLCISDWAEAVVKNQVRASIRTRATKVKLRFVFIMF